MSKRIPMATTDLFGLAQSAGQFGIEAKNIASFSETVAHIASATDILPAQAEKFAQFAAASNMPVENMDKFASSIVRLGNKFATSESNILNVAQRLAAFGSESLYKMAPANILALAAAIKQVGTSSYSGATAAQQVMNKMAESVAVGGDSLAIFARTANMSSESFKTLFENDSMEALVRFIEGIKTLKSRGADANVVLNGLRLRGQRAKETLFKLSGASHELRRAIDQSNEAWASGNEHIIEAETRYKTLTSRFQIFVNELFDAGRKFGDIINKVVADMLPVFTEVVKFFGSLSDQAKKFIIIGGLIAAAIGPLLLIVGSIVGIIAILAPLVGGAAAAIGVMSSVAIFATGIIVGLAAAFSYFGDEIALAARFWKDVFVSLFDWIVSIPGRIADRFSVAIDTISSKIYDVKKMLQNALPDFISEFIFGAKPEFGGAFGESEAFLPSVIWGGNGQSNSKSEVTIRIISENGTETSVDNVKKSGNTSLNVINDGFLGFNYGLGS